MAMAVVEYIFWWRKSGNLNLRYEVAMITRVRVRNGCTRFDESSGVTIPGNALHDHEARERRERREKAWLLQK